MEKPIVGYRVFDTESDFIEWQKNEQKSVCQISPIVKSIGITADTTSTNGAVTCAIFVTYIVDA